MSKSIKFKNDIYLDSSSIVHNKEKLSDILEPTILWENLNVSQNISSEQTINLSSPKYNKLKLVYQQSTNNNLSYIIEIPKGKSTRFSIQTLDGLCFRQLTYVTDTQFKISKIYTNSQYADTDRLVIPVRIIGYK